ncbi:MAG: DNA polymerase IV [Acidimicrobiales bacterium]
MGQLRRTILHADMDAFYVSVELRRRPELVGRPVVVGGSGDRGVVAAASYEARAYGVYSAMSSVVARRRCPQAVFLPGDHALYAEASEGLHEIFVRYTPVVEPIALDEAFLDVTGSARLHGNGPTIAHRIRREVRAELELGCPVGVAPNKFTAKLASEAAKPVPSTKGPLPGRGVVVVQHDEMISFLHPHPVRAVWGVGPATLKRLNALGISTVGDLAAVPVDALVASLGASHGRHLHELANARDNREVQSSAKVKSIGHEETFALDIFDRSEIETQLLRMCDAVASRLRKHAVVGKTVQLKLRYGDFTTITRSLTLAQATDATHEVAAAALTLLRREQVSSGIRLLGVSVSGLSDDRHRQLSLDDLNGASWEDATSAVDAIRERFGGDAIASGSSLTANEGLSVKHKGAQQWGPSR